VTFFDAQLRAGSLRAGDLEDLRFFGVAGALALGEGRAARADDVLRRWAELAGGALRRSRRAGIEAFAAVGVSPREIPRRGLEALLAELPHVLGRPRVVAVGPVGLDQGGAREEEVLERQLALAAELRLPVTVGEAGSARAARRALAVVAEAGLPPERVLVSAANLAAVRTIRGCGHVAALVLAGGALDEAVGIVRALGPDGIALASGAGDGAGDLLSLPRAAARMEKAGLSRAVIGRVCGGNARRWLGV
jgi:predicted metal-dependent TIM-barrel fold hydrolase